MHTFLSPPRRRPFLVSSAGLAPSVLACLMFSIWHSPGLLAQKPPPPISASAGFPSSEPITVWLGFFQTHSRLLNRAQKGGANNPGMLQHGNSQAARHF